MLRVANHSIGTLIRIGTEFLVSGIWCSMDHVRRGVVLMTENEIVTRYSDRTFPDYRFVPGRSPHPTRDPAGHSFGVEDKRLDSFDPEEWASCEPYLYGVDLFNHAFWWEAHEAWETVWRAAGRRSPSGLFVQGLIQISVAHLKSHQGFSHATDRLASDGLNKLSLQKSIYLGIDVSDFCTQVREYLDRARPHPAIIRLIGL